jgi:hypothetical protein
MKSEPNTTTPMSLSEQIHHAFYYSKGYDPIGNLKSNNASAMFDAYLLQNKSYASAITQQPSQVSFIAGFSKSGK